MYIIFPRGFEIRYWKFSDLIYVVMHLLSISTLLSIIYDSYILDLVFNSTHDDVPPERDQEAKRTSQSMDIEDFGGRHYWNPGGQRLWWPRL